MQDPSATNHALSSVQKLPTGIEGFDDICQGGLPIGRSTLISGTWREFLPGVEPGGLAVSDLNPVVGRSA